MWDFLYISHDLSNILYNIEVILTVDDVYTYGIVNEKICDKVFQLICKHSEL